MYLKSDNDLTIFKLISDIIVENRLKNVLSDVIEKVYSRNLSGKD